MPKIVSVHSFRHGTGQSNLTANLAVSIAQQGQHVGVINTQPAGVHTLFGVDNDKIDHILNYYLWGSLASGGVTKDASPSFKIEQGEVTVMGGGVYLSPTSIRVSDVPRLLRQGHDMGSLSQGFLELSRRLNLDCLFIETDPGLGEDTLLSIALCDVLLLILSLDHQNFQGVAVTVDIARKLGVPKILLVANQVLSSFETEEVREQLERTYGESVAAVLPFAEEMLELASSGIFCLQYPEHPLTHEFRAIAQQILALESREQVTAATQQATTREPQPTIDLNMFDVLTLPEAQRRVVNCIIRRGKATLSEIATSIGQDEAILYPILGTLVEQGFVQTLENEGQLQYRPYMSVKQKRKSSPNLWQALDGE
ncbi:P-loop NTPase [Oscillatoria sp. FACHB-1407]|uniref:MinD/ParA family ATP-binding protein n=1 Tax=Oscillatoria sp. FACHB-1407 TaxID=2692847 RepID=UPI001687149E|nr:MinD/ParA family protein [Oscillatoria sp. FACHB-1407]MBD2463281.1 P-loop NTPase [Oscillatoria sp. FACHB-1407]